MPNRPRTTFRVVHGRAKSQQLKTPVPAIAEPAIDRWTNAVQLDSGINKHHKRQCERDQQRRDQEIPNSQWTVIEAPGAEGTLGVDSNIWILSRASPRG